MIPPGVLRERFRAISYIRRQQKLLDRFNSPAETRKPEFKEFYAENRVKYTLGKYIKPHVFCSWDKFDPEKVKPVKNPLRWPYNKPQGGVWASPYTPEEKYCSPWIKFCCENDEDEWIQNCYLVFPEDNAKIAVIDSLKDYERLLAHYGRIIRTPKGRALRVLDFEKLAKDFDGLWVTEDGLAECSNNFLLEHRYGITSLWGWDLESIIWFKPKFKEVTSLDKIPHKCKAKCE